MDHIVDLKLGEEIFSILTRQDAFGGKLWVYICETTDMETVRILLSELFAIIPRLRRVREDNAFNSLSDFLAELGSNLQFQIILNRCARLRDPI